jgi:integrase
MAGRRANGEGTIYKRKDGRYEAAVYLLTVSGKRKRVRVYGKTREEVHGKLTTAKAQAQQGVPVADQRWTLNAYFDYWLEHAVRIKRRPLTYRRHEAVVRLHLKPGLGRWSLNQLSVQTVQDFLDQLFADGQSAASIHQIRKVLSAALTYALRKELLFRNVARLVELPSYVPDEARHWTLDETVRFLQAARQDPLYPAFVLLALYGLRRGEVLGLRWCDIDFEHGILHVRQQVQRVSGSLRQVPLKTRASRRDEPLLAKAREVLSVQRARQATARATAGASWQGEPTDEELVFTTRTGQPVESRNLYRSFLRLCAQHGIRRITIHGMRHTNATTQKILQVHDRDIQAILGHGDVRTTGIYEHVDLASKRTALEKVEGRLFEPPTASYSRLSRQLLPSGCRSVDFITMYNFGGASQTRTGDTRLFRAISTSSDDRLTTVRLLVERRATTWYLGCVAVKYSRQSTELHYSPDWRQRELPSRRAPRSEAQS